MMGRESLSLGPTRWGLRANEDRDADRVPVLVRHLTHALSVHVRTLHEQRMPVPPELGSLTEFLLRSVRIRQDSPSSAGRPVTRQAAPMADQLLVTKGQAAERLSVSVRTVERLVSTGRLSQVQLDRSARFRVKDLEEYVENLDPTSRLANDGPPSEGPRGLD